MTAVINSHLAHMRIEFSCTASSMIVSVTNAGSSRLCRPMLISVARYAPTTEPDALAADVERLLG